MNNWFKKIALTAGLLVGSAFGQNIFPAIVDFPGVPTGSCQPDTFALNDATGDLYTCFLGTWFKVGGNNAPPFNSIASGVNTTATMTCGTGCTINTSGSGVNAATTVPFSGNTTSNNTNTLGMSGAGSFTPSTASQVAGDELWSSPGEPILTVVLNNSGGNLLNNHTVSFVYTLNTARGETAPSTETKSGTGSSCVGANQCQLVVTAPAAYCGALPCGPFTGYTLYTADQGSFISGQETRQTSNNNCVNITTNCTVNAGGGGPAFSFTSTAFVNPLNIQPTTSGVQSGLVPSWYVNDWNTGNTFVQGGMIGNTNANFNGSTFTEIRRHWFDDTGFPQVASNAFISINHVQNGTFTSLGNQDRGLAINTGNCAPLGTGCADSATHYAIEGIQVETDISGTPVFNGSPDYEITAGSFQLGFGPTGFTPGSGFGSNAVRASFFRQPNAVVDNIAMTGINTGFSNSSTVNGGGSSGYGILSGCSQAAASAPGLACTSYGSGAPSTTDFGNGFNTIWQRLNASFVPANKDALIRNDQYNMNTVLGGPVFATILATSNAVPLIVSGDLSVNGSITIAQETSAGFTNPTCTGGASQYTYRFVGVDTNGGTVAGNQLNSPATCTNPLTSGNPATFSNPPVPGPAGFIRYDLYRTGGPMGTGKIGCVGLTGSGCTWIWPNGIYNPQLGLISGSSPTVADTGLTADGSTVPSVNTTGGIVVPGISHISGNILQVGPSGFTTANNTNLQTITGLSFNISTAAVNYSFHCALSYSQATANAAVAFGIQAATVNPTNIFATGDEQITVGPPATTVTGTLTTLATTTATNIVSGTPGAITTNYRVYLDGTIEEPANGSGNTINFMVSTATGADAVTVLRGSYCQIF